jgi:hypothetical protein
MAGLRAAKLGLGTNHISFPSEFPTNGCLTPLLLDKNTTSSAHLLMPSEKVDLVIQNIIHPSSQKLSEPCRIAWHRPTSWLTKQTPASTWINNLHSFYNANFKYIMQMINQSLPKWQLQAQSFTRSPYKKR